MWWQNPDDRHWHRHRYHYWHHHRHWHHNACRRKSNWRTDNHAGYRSRQWYAIDDVGRKHRYNHQLNLNHAWKRYDDRFDYKLNLDHATWQDSTWETVKLYRTGAQWRRWLHRAYDNR